MHAGRRDYGFGHRTLANIATTLPGATAVFRSRKLDFCCNGTALLSEAAAAKGISLPDIESALEEMAANGNHAALPLEPVELIELIEKKFHAVHRRELPELVRLAKRVEAVHRFHPGVPRGLTAHLERMAQELEGHMQKEEAILFPWMRQGGGPMIKGPIALMMSEHEEQGADLRSLEVLTNGFTAPEEACTSWRALCLGARKFCGDVMEHIHQENNILFPLFSAPMTLVPSEQNS